MSYYLCTNKSFNLAYIIKLDSFCGYKIYGNVLYIKYASDITWRKENNIKYKSVISTKQYNIKKYNDMQEVLIDHPDLMLL